MESSYYSQVHLFYNQSNAARACIGNWCLHTMYACVRAHTPLNLAVHAVRTGCSNSPHKSSHGLNSSSAGAVTSLRNICVHMFARSHVAQSLTFGRSLYSLTLFRRSVPSPPATRTSFSLMFAVKGILNHCQCPIRRTHLWTAHTHIRAHGALARTCHASAPTIWTPLRQRRSRVHCRRVASKQRLLRINRRFVLAIHHGSHFRLWLFDYYFRSLSKEIIISPRNQVIKRARKLPAVFGF
jgi:hypothetical protein